MAEIPIRSTPCLQHQSRTRNLLIATSNPGKVSEITSLTEGLGFRVLGLADFPEINPAIEETGVTFAANALLKADHFHSLTGWLTLADDSGLEVDALGGRPGVYSARYGGEGKTSAEQINLLLDELKDVPEEGRSARFVCCIALVGNLTGHQIRQVFEADCLGMISRSPRGNGGFGYDPVFLDVELGRTFAELTREEKALRSHRGQALRQARAFLANLLQ